MQFGGLHLHVDMYEVMHSINEVELSLMGLDM